ncbi:unnamed protein product, partial [marine sediment metagenome]
QVFPPIRVGCIVIQFLPAVPVMNVVIPLAVNRVVRAMPEGRMGYKSRPGPIFFRVSHQRCKTSTIKAIPPGETAQLDKGRIYVSGAVVSTVTLSRGAPRRRVSPWEPSNGYNHREILHSLRALQNDIAGLGCINVLGVTFVLQPLGSF